MTAPAVTLLPYQREIVEDRSRYRYDLICRQGGKDFSESLAAVLDCHERRTDWVVLCAGEGQTKQFIRQARVHAEAIDAAAQSIEGREQGSDGKDYLRLELRFPRGSTLIGLPANPDTARGHSANLILNEFAFHQHSHDIWRAAFPTITRGYRLRIITTPNGKSNKAYDLWQAENGYVKRRITIHDAIAQGLTLYNEDGTVCTAADLKRALADDEAFAQEYELEFLDEVSAWLTYELISQVEAAECVKRPQWVDLLVAMAEQTYAHYVQKGQDPPAAAWEMAREIVAPLLTGELYLGMDIGRMRDLTDVWLGQKVGAVLGTEAVIELRRKPFFVQKFILHTLLSLPNLRRACLDQSGLGRQLTEEAQDKFGTARVEGVDFTAANKEVLAVLIKDRAEARTVRIPADHHTRTSLHSVKRYQTATGHFRFDAERTEKTGHADEFWALGLCLQAASTSIAPADAGREPTAEDLAPARRSIFDRLMPSRARLAPSPRRPLAPSGVSHG